MRNNKFLVENVSLIRLSHDEIVINPAKFRAKHRWWIFILCVQQRDSYIRLVGVNTNFAIMMSGVCELASDITSSSFTNESVIEAQTDL